LKRTGACVLLESARRRILLGWNRKNRVCPLRGGIGWKRITMM
jgi:hypothetical protein